MEKHIKNFKSKGRERTSAYTEAVEHDAQIRHVNILFLSGAQEDIERRILSEVKRKRNGYKSQDVRREIYDSNLFISLEQTLEHLVSSRLRCAYCHEKVDVVYTQVRSPTQWTLDRIDNEVGHHAENTVVSCLRCNLRRRTTDYDKFVFTRELKLVKGT